MLIKKKLIAITIISMILSTSAACDSKSENSAKDISSSSIETTEANIETSISEIITKEITTEEIIETTTDFTTTDSESITNEEISSTNNENIITNAQLLNMINNAFGMMTDNTFENDLQTAKDWDIVNESDIIDKDAKITAEFLISASMRATGFVNGESSMDEIIQCAIDKGVISDSDISKIDLTTAKEIVDKAQYSWSHQEFENEINIELVDGVIDFKNILTADDIKIDGNIIEIPAAFANDITTGTVFIVPDSNDIFSDGTAYKAEAISEGTDGMAIINVTPATFEEVYKNIG